MRGPDSERNRGLSGLFELTLKSPKGESVPLSAIARVIEQQAFAVVQRREGKLAVSVTANVDSTITTAGQVLSSLESEALPALRAKYRVKTSFEGRAETQRQTFADLRTGTVLSLALIYLILAFVFQRWLQPLSGDGNHTFWIRRNGSRPLYHGFQHSSFFNDWPYSVSQASSSMMRLYWSIA